MPGDGRAGCAIRCSGPGPAAFAICALSALLFQTKGLPGRFSAEEQRLLVEEIKDGKTPCDEQTDWREIADCQIGAADAPGKLSGLGRFPWPVASAGAERGDEASGPTRALCRNSRLPHASGDQPDE